MKSSFFEKALVLLNALLLFFQLMLMGTIPSLFNFPILNLFIPLLIVINIIFFISWLLRIKWPFLMFIIAFLIGYSEWGLLYQFPRNTKQISSDTFKVMSYNVRLFNRYDWISDIDAPKEIENFINKEKPDIICFQEYSKIDAPLLDAYPYSYIQPIVPNNKSGVAILSKFPIINSGYIDFEKSTNSGIFSDIEYKGKTIRVYNLHLESLHIDLKDTLISNANSEGLQLKFNQVFNKQLQQVDQFKKVDLKNKNPTIICTDLNNSQFSSIYKNLKQGRNDTFSEAGTGLGTTFHFLFFPLRIDFIFVDPTFKVDSFSSHKIDLSDHRPITTTLEWK